MTASCFFALSKKLPTKILCYKGAREKFAESIAMSDYVKCQMLVTTSPLPTVTRRLNIPAMKNLGFSAT